MRQEEGEDVARETCGCVTGAEIGEMHASMVLQWIFICNHQGPGAINFPRAASQQVLHDCGNRLQALGLIMFQAHTFRVACEMLDEIVVDVRFLCGLF